MTSSASFGKGDHFGDMDNVNNPTFGFFVDMMFPLSGNVSFSGSARRAFSQTPGDDFVLFERNLQNAYRAGFPEAIIYPEHVTD
jgi:hypothetical protein